MNQIIRFTPKHDASAHQNLKNFIALARDELTLWSNLKCFSWDAAVWPTTNQAIRFIIFEHRNLHACKPPKTHQLMHPAFANAAKAYMRYTHTLRQKKTISVEMTALRAIDFALRQDMAVPDISKFEQRHWDKAINAVQDLSSRQRICSYMKEILCVLAELFILTADPRFWKHPYVRKHSFDSTRGSRAPDEVKANKIPDQDALLAIAEVFSRGDSETLEDVAVMITCITGLLLSAPMRIGETLRLRTDCLRTESDKNRILQHYLAYWVPKIGEFDRKAIPKTMAEVASKSIQRLTNITEESRRLARYIETNPSKFYRHANCPNVPDNQVLTGDQVAQALGYTCRSSCEPFIKRHTGNSRLAGLTLDSLWQMVLAENRTLNPHFPYQEAPGNSAQPPLKMSDSLLCFRRYQMSYRFSTSPVLLTPFVGAYYGNRLSTANKQLQSMNFFVRNGYEISKLKSHSLRHLLNRLGRSSGVSVEVLTAWSSRATTQQTRTYLHDDPTNAAIKGAALFGTTQEQAPLNPVTNEEAELYGQGPYHRSRYGICRRSWRAGPCNKFADCLNCSELLMCKGDKYASDIIKLERDNLVLTYTAAQQAIAKGERAASRWTELAGRQIERLNQLLGILHDSDIPDGSPIELAGEDFNHEKIIVSQKAITSGVRLLDRKDLGLAYGDELLACLELLRSPENA